MKQELYLYESEQSSSDVMNLYKLEEVYRGYGIYISQWDNVTVMDNEYNRLIESIMNVFEAKQIINGDINEK